VTRYIVGVVVERTQSAEVLVEVEADTKEDALKLASVKARKLDRADLYDALSNVDWETDSYLDVGYGVDVYDPRLYEADFPFDGESK
jgi:hypothetical protein